MKKFLSFLVFGVLPFGIFAQNLVKKPLSETDYAIWNTIGNEKISHSGEIVVYEVNPQKGDGRLIIRNLSGHSDTIPRGKKPEIGSNDDFVVFSITQPEDTLRKAKIKKVKKEDMPQDSLGILVFKNQILKKYGKLKSFSIPEENTSVIAFMVTPEVKKDTSKNARKTKQIKQPGDNLIIFSLKTNDTTVFRNVTEFSWPKKGRALFFVQQKKDSSTTWSFLKKFDVSNETASQLFFSDGTVKKVVADEKGENYAFLFSKDTAQIKVYSLFMGSNNQTVPAKVADATTSGMPDGWSPSENGTIYFSKDATKLYLNSAPSPSPEPKDTIPEDEKPRLDVWNWQDATLQPQQKVDLEKDKKRSYLAVYHLNQKKFVQLADTVVREASLILKGNTDIGLGANDQPYLRAGSWKGDASRDYYLIDLKSGDKRQVAVNKERLLLSPAGKYVIWYEQTDSCWVARSTSPENNKIVPLTKMIKVFFADEENDLPDNPRPYGIAGWSENDKFVFIYDRYDIWKIDPLGEKVPVCVTDTYGRRNHMQFRYLKTDPEEEWIPQGKVSLLKAFNQTTMEGGFYLTDLFQVKEPSLLIMGKNIYGMPRKAKNAGKILWTKESVSDFPDLWTSNLAFEKPEQLSNANPQQKEFNWLTAELVEWKSFTGEILKGLLYKPENFDPGLKYPMIVYYYEKNSEGLYRYSIPTPSRSTINRSFYCSNGYLVFIPDITYRIGYPGQSAYDAIVSGVYNLANTRTYVDITKVGLQGQSWGGYQTAYLITQTDLFAAAMAGAPVSNMTSAYGGIRWETGISRMFQYEHTQSRIGGTLWEKPLLYIENSPLFYAPKVKTPLLMMANDNDGAVPWYQGIEFFTALRRLDRPVWMLSYNGEPHNLKGESWANRMDLDKRMFQFFNHYLKGEAMPEWMEKGVSALDKGKKMGY
jgi:dipeptidyl aminopeptidase/acylaminoacyl peptidase